MGDRRGELVRLASRVFVLVCMAALLQFAATEEVAASAAACGAADSACHNSCYTEFLACYYNEEMDPNVCSSDLAQCGGFCQAAYWDCLAGPPQCTYLVQCQYTIGHAFWRCYNILFSAC